jgi:Homeodomain-like domain-containing protein
MAFGYFQNKGFRDGGCRRPIKMSLLCQLEMTLPRGFPGVSGVTVRVMSDGELTRLEVLRDLDQRRLTTEAATRLLGLERRQVFRLLKAYRTGGPAGSASVRVYRSKMSQPPGRPMRCLPLRLRSPSGPPTTRSPSSWRFGTAYKTVVLSSSNPISNNIRRAPSLRWPEHGLMPLRSVVTATKADAARAEGVNVMPLRQPSPILR